MAAAASDRSRALPAASRRRPAGDRASKPSPSAGAAALSLRRGHRLACATRARSRRWWRRWRASCTAPIRSASSTTWATSSICTARRRTTATSSWSRTPATARRSSAIAGNHDGELGPGKTGEPLAPFVRALLRPRRGAAADGTGSRTVPQPNVYWTLEHDFVTIVGLYTDVPEGGLIAEEQRRWLIGELADARTDATLILAMHHPVFSADTSHGSNLALGDAARRLLRGGGPRARRRVQRPRPQLPALQPGARRPDDSVRGRRQRRLSRDSRLGYGIPDTPASFAGLPGADARVLPARGLRVSHRHGPTAAAPGWTTAPSSGAGRCASTRSRSAPPALFERQGRGPGQSGGAGGHRAREVAEQAEDLAGQRVGVRRPAPVRASS